ncbi:MAG: HAD family phosphatase [Nanoarchaeota archaeon]
MVVRISKYKLVCFDVDGTLVDNIVFSWQLFHEYLKTDIKKREETRQKYYNGEITYLDWANHDIQMWIDKGAKKEDFFRALRVNKVKLMNGAIDTLKALKEKGIKLAIISGSLNIILEFVLPDYNEYFDDVFLSWMYFNDEGMVERVEVTEYDMMAKADALKMIASREGISLSECVFIGDHHNDVRVAKEAGLSIAFDCKDEELARVADVVINKKDLREVLKFIIQ